MLFAIIEGIHCDEHEHELKLIEAPSIRDGFQRLDLDPDDNEHIGGFVGNLMILGNQSDSHLWILMGLYHEYRSIDYQFDIGAMIFANDRDQAIELIRQHPVYQSDIRRTLRKYSDSDVETMNPLDYVSGDEGGYLSQLGVGFAQADPEQIEIIRNYLQTNVELPTTIDLVVYILEEESGGDPLVIGYQGTDGRFYDNDGNLSSESPVDTVWANIKPDQTIVVYNGQDDNYKTKEFNNTTKELLNPTDEPIYSFAILNVPTQLIPVNEHLTIVQSPIRTWLDNSLISLNSMGRLFGDYWTLTGQKEYQMYILSLEKVYIKTPEGYWNVQTHQIEPGVKVIEVKIEPINPIICLGSDQIAKDIVNQTPFLTFRAKPQDDVVVFFTPSVVRVNVNQQTKETIAYSNNHRDSPIIKIITLQGSPDQSLIEMMQTRTKTEHGVNLSTSAIPRSIPHGRISDEILSD